MSQDILILEGARTPMCRYTGQFSRVSAIELRAVAAQGAMERAGVDASHIDHVVIGKEEDASFRQLGFLE